MIFNYLAFVVPFFLFFIGLEYIVAKWKNKNYHEFIAGVIIVTLISCGAILEQRLWVFHVEYIRGILLAMTLLAFFPSQSLLLGVSLIGVAILLFSSTLQSRYLQLIYG